MVLNLSRFSCGMGFIILVFRGGGGCVIIAIKVFGGIFRMMDRWSELRFCSWSVIDVYVVACCMFV